LVKVKENNLIGEGKYIHNLEINAIFVIDKGILQMIADIEIVIEIEIDMILKVNYPINV